jgi:polysaccharide biosynthesis transport protein
VTDIHASESVDGPRADFRRDIDQADTQRSLAPGPLAAGFTLFLRRNVRRIILLTLVFSPGLFMLSRSLFQRYSATALVMLDPRSQRVIDRAGVLENIGADFNAIESMVQVAKSEGFAGAVVDRLDLAHNSVFAGQGATAELLRQSTIRNIPDYLIVARRGTTYVIDVTVRSSSAMESARLANGAAQQLIDDQTSLRAGLSSTTARAITTRLTELRGRVNRAEKAVADFKTQLKVTDAGQGGTLLEHRLSELNQQRILAASHTAEARARYDLLRNVHKAGVERLPQDAQSAVLTALSGELARLLKSAADQGAVLGPLHPEMVRLNAQIANVRRQIGAEVVRLASVAQSDLAETEQREAELTRQLEQAQDESNVLGPQQVKLKQLEREAEAERGVFEAMLRRQRELVEVSGLEPSDLRLVSVAAAPQKPSPGTSLLALASCGVGLLLGVLLAAVAERRRPTLRTRADAESLGGVEHIAFAPEDLCGKETARSALELPNLMPWLAELGSDIAAAGSTVVVLISSTRRNQGRSTIAVNLAAFLSQGGDRVLLVEADRAAHVARPAQGLLDVLWSGVNLRSALIFQDADGYSLLPYGGVTLESQSRRDVAGLMSGATLRATLNVAREWFDVVVIDGPPALEAPHARFLAAQADRIVLVVEWDKTTKHDAEMALDGLEATTTAIVYNKTDFSRLALYDPAPVHQLAGRALSV